MRVTVPESRVVDPTGASFWTPSPSIDLARLIGRPPRLLDRDRVSKTITGRRVLITGAGGSIGSHLAHVAAQFDPACIVLMERSENALFEIDRQLSRRYPGVARRALLHDVVDADDTSRVLSEVRPHMVFHAAAHKHVPLMENHPSHAVVNNVFGTASIADASISAGVQRFVMISSDKAVNPSSVMGATKRLAEMYVSHLAGSADRSGGSADEPRFSMVRFGNVLGSVGSVLTIWSSQIAEGGPVTITDPRMTRYFMTIPEAAGLVIASSTLDEQPSGAVYVLDMGDPIRIVELARRYVRAHGFAPRFARPSDSIERSLIDLVEEAMGTESRDRIDSAPDTPVMDIVFTGARPGEKIHEELAYAAESLRPTSHPGINSWCGLSERPVGTPPTIDIPSLMMELQSAVRSRDQRTVFAILRGYMPSMAPRS
ncbi:MAG: polysaccharide biosynthesis protein [Phycisphaerales bacterium]